MTVKFIKISCLIFSLSLFVPSLCWSKTPRVGQKEFDFEMSPAEKQRFIAFITLWEFNRDPARIVEWNEGESFPSAGIGHYLWYPKYEDSAPPDFEESFPLFFLNLFQTQCFQGVFPPILKYESTSGKIAFAPWKNREEFLREAARGFNKPLTPLAELKNFLNSAPVQICQVNFQIERLKATVREIFAAVSDRQFEDYFYKVFRSQGGPTAVLDYVNFKGTGMNPREVIRDPQGREFRWGLRQVLEQGRRKFESEHGAMAPLSAFKNAGIDVLTERARIQPSVARFLPGWINRLNSYESARKKNSK